MSNGTVRTTCGNGRVEPTRQASVRDKDAVNSNYVRSLAQDARRWVFRPVPTCSLPQAVLTVPVGLQFAGTASTYVGD
jgi:hypothetical protein